jgi:hypothetical protein
MDRLQECIIVCVVSLEEVEISPGTVHFKQCREVRTATVTKESHMDKIIIAASSAICLTVVVAMIVFICCCKRKKSSDSTTGLTTSSKDEIRPVSYLQPRTVSGPPLASLGTLPSLHHPQMRTRKEWDQISTYSGRSIPRARMYHMEKGELFCRLT